MTNTARVPAPSVRRLATPSATRRSAATLRSIRPETAPKSPKSGTPAFRQSLKTSLTHHENGTLGTERNETEHFHQSSFCNPSESPLPPNCGAGFKPARWSLPPRRGKVRLEVPSATRRSAATLRPIRPQNRPEIAQIRYSGVPPAAQNQLNPPRKRNTWNGMERNGTLLSKFPSATLPSPLSLPTVGQVSNLPAGPFPLAGGRLGWG